MTTYQKLSYDANGPALSATGAGHTVSLTFNATTRVHSGLQGLTLSRDAVGQPLGLTLSSGGTAYWDTIALDAATQDLVLSYDHLTSLDTLRTSTGGFFAFGNNAGAPVTTQRVLIHSTSASADTGCTDLLRLDADVGAGSPVVRAMAVAQNGTRVSDLTINGYGAFGMAWSAELSTGSLEALNGALIFATDGDQTLRFWRGGTSTQRWDVKSYNGGSPVNIFALTDVTGSKRIIQVEPGADANALYIGASATGITLAAAASKLGFFGATPIVKPISTTDLRVAMINLGLLTTGGATPLDLNGGTITSPLLTIASGTELVLGVSGDTASLRTYRNMIISDTKNLIFSGTTGSKIGTATSQKIGFWNAAPIVQPTGTPAAATDLATVITLANSLRTNLLATGLVA